jgi:hypothetical protein
VIIVVIVVRLKMRSTEFSIHLFDSEPETRQKRARSFGTSPPITRTSARQAQAGMHGLDESSAKTWKERAVLGFGSALTVCSVASCDARAFDSIALEFGSVFAPARLWAAQSKLDGTLDSGSALAYARFGGTVCSVYSHCRIGILARIALCSGSARAHVRFGGAVRRSFPLPRGH